MLLPLLGERAGVRGNGSREFANGWLLRKLQYREFSIRTASKCPVLAGFLYRAADFGLSSNDALSPEPAASAFSPSNFVTTFSTF